MLPDTIKTARLLIRKPRLEVDEDISVIYDLWTDPKVVENVGFPKGIPCTKEEIIERIKNQKEFVNAILIIETRDSKKVIGSTGIRLCSNLISKFDMKILPSYWGKGYGTEALKGIIEYIFKYTETEIIQGEPNKKNMPSIKMQEKAGMKRVGEAVYKFPEKMKGYTQDVEHWIYEIKKQ